MGLTVIVGDVHGCAAELEDALEQLQFVEGDDRLIFVGDLVVRGPDSVGVLALARRLEARVVRGNHEDKLLAWHHHARPLGPEHERVARALTDEDWQMLDQMPLWIDLPDHGVRVVHAGVVPGMAIGRTPPDALLKMRTIDARDGWSDEPDAGPLWGSLYQGAPHVVFGHNARAEPQLHDWATGIDTGCVYGGRLTCAVLAEREPMPRGRAAREVLRSVRARRSYYPWKGSSLPA